MTSEAWNNLPPTMDIRSEPGTKVVFAYPNNGYPADGESAAEHLTEGAEYTVKICAIHDWKTRVELEEVPGVQFNSVMFAALATARGEKP